VEVMRDAENSCLVDFFDVEALADRIATALATNSDGAGNGIRAAARQTAIDRYDIHTVTLPAYLDLLRSLM
jgi:glycosyltransferase involved in cell wall biosynthesis